MTDHLIVRLLADLIHIFTRMETEMALNFDDLTAQIADLEKKVSDLKSVPAGTGVDEAAAQAKLDAVTVRAKAALAEFETELTRLKTVAAPPPVVTTPDPSVATPL